jgi:DNA-binding MarR family transcriptional regulator
MSTPDLSAQLGELLMRATRGLRRRWAESLEPWELTPHQARALQVVGELGDPRLGALADRLRIAPRSATEVIDGLEERGLVVRGSDPSDRRAICVGLTAAGREVLDGVTAARVGTGSVHFAVLSPTERATLAGLLAKLDQAGPDGGGSAGRSGPQIS